MKNLILFGSMFFGSLSFACDQQEAQIIAKISSVVKNTNSCVAQIELKDIRFFSSSMVCPLDQVEVLNLGVNVGIKDGHDCRRDVGDEINGIIYRVSSGEIYIE
ncbi:MAG: hypothetical protein RJB66_556 [Pseudomonadota bacterium]